MSRPQATAETLVDNDRVRVTRFTFAPGAETGWHRHEYDYVITAVTDCMMQLEQPDGGVRETDVAAGQCYYRDRGVEHNVVNRGDAAMSFIETEIR